MVCTLVGAKVLLCSLISEAEMRLHGLARGWGVLSLHHPLPLKEVVVQKSTQNQKTGFIKISSTRCM